MKRPNMTPRVGPNPPPATHPLGLRAIVYAEMERKGFDCDLNHLDISQLTSLDGVFAHLLFTGDISRWDVAHITSFNNTFLGTPFNGDISQWNMGSAQSMIGTFERSAFKGDLSQWSTANVVTMAKMFRLSQFSGDLSQWDVRKVTNMQEMFDSSQFNGLISTWRVDELREMGAMFMKSPFNGDLSSWRPTEASITQCMFHQSAFNGDLSQWRLPVWATVSDMFSASFSGVLPRKAGLAPPYEDYAKMMGNSGVLDEYLRTQPLNSVHVELVLHNASGKRPKWLSEKDHAWMEEQKAMLDAMACTIEDSHTLLMAALHERTNPLMDLPSGALDGMGL